MRPALEQQPDAALGERETAGAAGGGIVLGQHTEVAVGVEHRLRERVHREAEHGVRHVRQRPGRRRRVIADAPAACPAVTVEATPIAPVFIATCPPAAL